MMNGAGALIYSFTSVLHSTVLGAGAVDGVFSMVLSVVTGSVTVDPFAHVYIDNDTQGPGPVAGVPVGVPAAVPEPATLTLLGAGVAAGVWRRRRRTV